MSKQKDLTNRFKLGLIVFACALPFLIVKDCHGQNLDSLNQRILKLEMNQRNIQLNLNKAHKQFSTGTLMVLTGAILTTAGAILTARDNDATSKAKNNNALLYVGAAMTTTGVVIQIDSHKWIGRAGQRKR